MRNYKKCHCEASVMDGAKESRSNLVVLHGDEVALSPLHANPSAPRNDMVFILSSYLRLPNF